MPSQSLSEEKVLVAGMQLSEEKVLVEGMQLVDVPDSFFFFFLVGWQEPPQPRVILH